jgi:hypothetical protein
MKCSEETEILEEALFQSTLFATNPTWPNLGSKSGHHDGKLATKFLSYCTAICVTDLVKTRGATRLDSVLKSGPLSPPLVTCGWRAFFKKTNLFAISNNTFSKWWEGLRMTCRRVFSSTPRDAKVFNRQLWTSQKGLSCIL